MIASPVRLPLAAGPIPPPRCQVDYYGKLLRWRYVRGGRTLVAGLVEITDNGGRDAGRWSCRQPGKVPPWVQAEGRPA